MRIQFLGTGGYHPNERRHTACLLFPETGVVFDAGTAFFRVARRLETAEIQVFLSHAHLDHIAGLTYFLVPLMTGQVRRARVYANEKTLEAVRTHLFSEPTFPVLPGFEFQTLEEEPAEIPLGDGGRLRWHPLVSHPGGSTAFRIDWPAADGRDESSLAYVTDTTVDGTYTDFIRGVDLLIHECNFPDERAELCGPTGHSHTSQVTGLAAAADVGRLILLHIDPQMPGDDPLGLDEARQAFPATELAEDLQVLEF
jgi:ribonuclease BN (tRNA processing enzyme)